MLQVNDAHRLQIASLLSFRLLQRVCREDRCKYRNGNKEEGPRANNARQRSDHRNHSGGHTQDQCDERLRDQANRRSLRSACAAFAVRQRELNRESTAGLHGATLAQGRNHRPEFFHLTAVTAEVLRHA
jgi:hypothetical protein